MFEEIIAPNTESSDAIGTDNMTAILVKLNNSHLSWAINYKNERSQSQFNFHIITFLFML